MQIAGCRAQIEADIRDTGGLSDRPANPRTVLIRWNLGCVCAISVCC